MDEWSLPSTPSTWLLLLAGGFAHIGGQFFLTLGLKYELAAGVAIMRTIGMILDS